MENLEVVRGETLVLEQGDGEAVAHGELHGGGGGRRKAMRTGLLGARQFQQHVALLAEGGLRLRRDRDQRHLEAARIVENVGEFRALPGPGQRDDDVLAVDHAEVAVARLARMHEERWRSRGGEGRGELLTHVAALADAGDDHAALGRGKGRHGLREGVAELAIERRPQGLQPLALEFEGARCRKERAGNDAACRLRHAGCPLRSVHYGVTRAPGKAIRPRIELPLL